MATLPKVLINQADSKSAGGVALRVRTQASQPGCGLGLWVSTHFAVGLNNSRHNVLNLKLDRRLIRVPHSIDSDDIQLVRAADHHESSRYPTGRVADATTVDLHTPIGGQSGLHPGARRGG